MVSKPRSGARRSAPRGISRPILFISAGHNHRHIWIISRIERPGPIKKHGPKGVFETTYTLLSPICGRTGFGSTRALFQPFRFIPKTLCQTQRSQRSQRKGAGQIRLHEKIRYFFRLHGKGKTCPARIDTFVSTSNISRFLPHAHTPIQKQVLCFIDFPFFPYRCAANLNDTCFLCVLCVLCGINSYPKSVFG